MVTVRKEIEMRTGRRKCKSCKALASAQKYPSVRIRTLCYIMRAFSPQPMLVHAHFFFAAFLTATAVLVLDDLAVFVLLKTLQKHNL